MDNSRTQRPLSDGGGLGEAMLDGFVAGAYWGCRYGRERDLTPTPAEILAEGRSHSRLRAEGSPPPASPRHHPSCGREKDEPRWHCHPNCPLYAAEGGDTLTPETPLETARLRYIGQLAGGNWKATIDAAADRIAAARQLAAQWDETADSLFDDAEDYADTPVDDIVMARALRDCAKALRALVGDEAP